MPEKRILALPGSFTSFFWRYAWINYLTLAACGRNFPLIGALLFFFLSYAINFISSGRGLRLITIVLFNIIGFSLILLGFINYFYGIQESLFTPAWIADFFSMSREISGWLSLLLVMTMPFLLWAGGFNMVRKRARYISGFTGLDIGVTAFFVLFLVKFIMRTQVGTVIPDPVSIRAFFLCFISCVSGILLSKQRNDVEHEFERNHRGAGIIISFLAVLVIIIISAFLLMPLLNTAADTGYGIIKTVAGPVGDILVRILRFLLLGRDFRNEVQGSSGSGSGDSGGGVDAADSSGLFGIVVGYIILGLIILIAAGLVAVLIWMLVRKLLNRTQDDRSMKRHRGAGYLLFMLKKVLEGLKLVSVAFIKNITGRYAGIGEIYTAFLRWGARGGMARRGNETPEEYKTRLVVIYPFAADEICRITESFNSSCYGDKKLEDPEIATALKSLGRLKSPRLFPARIISWFRQ